MQPEIEALRDIARRCSDATAGFYTHAMSRGVDTAVWWWIGGAKRQAGEAIPRHINIQDESLPRFTGDLHAADMLFQHRSASLRAGGYRIDYDHGMPMVPPVRARVSVSQDSFACGRGHNESSSFEAFGCSAPLALVAAICRAEAADREGRLAAQAFKNRGSL